MKLFSQLSTNLNRFLQGHGNRVVENILWLLLDRGVRIVLGVAVGVWLARYLGPSNFGILSYVIACLALMSPIVNLGLEDIVVRDIIHNPHLSQEILGTTFFLQIASGFLTIVALNILLAWQRQGDTELRTIMAILSLGFVFQSTGMIKYWYQAHIRSKRVVQLQMIALVVTSLLRIACIMLGASLQTFAWLILAESGIVSAGLAAMYFSRESIPLRFSIQRAYSLLRNSWPLVLSGLAVVTYMRIDQVMLGSMQNDQAVGIYSAALTISEAWYFVPMAIVASIFPLIIQNKKLSETIYLDQTQLLLSSLFLISLLAALLFSASSKPLINLLYGQHYLDAAAVLSIHAWAGIFVSLGIASGRWYINESLQILQFYKMFAGAAANITLNFILIPEYGAIGAAIATVISFSIAAYFSDYFFSATRPMFKMKSRALLLRGLLSIRSQS